MNKFKMLGLSLVVAISFGASATFSNVQAAESFAPEISVASETLWYSKEVPFTYTDSMWVSVTQNGKTYVGYIYNRGYAVGKPGYSFFSGTLRVGPYAPNAILEQE